MSFKFKIGQKVKYIENNRDGISMINHNEVITITNKKSYNISSDFKKQYRCKEYPHYYIPEVYLKPVKNRIKKLEGV